MHDLKTLEAENLTLKQLIIDIHREWLKSIIWVDRDGNKEISPLDLADLSLIEIRMKDLNLLEALTKDTVNTIG